MNILTEKLNPVRKNYNMDLAIEELGGFGRFQALATIVLSIARNSGCFLFYSFALLTAAQSFVCATDGQTEMSPCTNDLICSELGNGHAVDYAADTSDPNYFSNWYLQMNLLCKPVTMIGLLFTFERITEGIVGCSIVGLTDKLGRKKSTILFLGINLCAQTLIIFCPSYTFRMVGFILYGCGQIKNSVLYVWLFENMHTRNKSSAVTFLNMLDSSTLVIFGLYVLYVSRNWLDL